MCVSYNQDNNNKVMFLIAVSIETATVSGATVILTQAEEMMALFGVKEADLTVKSLTLGGSSALIMLIVPLSLLVLSDVMIFRLHFRFMRRNLGDLIDVIRELWRSKKVDSIMTLDQLKFEDTDLFES